MGLASFNRMRRLQAEALNSTATFAAAKAPKPNAVTPPAQTGNAATAAPGAAEALALAGGNFMAFKSAARKVLGDAMPAKKPEIIAALEALAGGGEPVSETPDGTPTPIPEAWEVMTDDEMLELGAELSGGPVTASGDQTPAERARSIIQATVDCRANPPAKPA